MGSPPLPLHTDSIPSSPILEENATLFECYDSIQKPMTISLILCVPPQQFFVSFHFYLFHVRPRHEYSFPLCLFHLFFPCPPYTHAIEPGSLEGADDRAVARLPRRPSCDCVDCFRLVVQPSSIIGSSAIITVAAPAASSASSSMAPLRGLMFVPLHARHGFVVTIYHVNCSGLVVRPSLIVGICRYHC